MKKLSKSWLAIAAALTLTMGFTSCAEDEPTPGPDPNPVKDITTSFFTQFAINTDFADYYDITLEYVNLAGDTTTQSIKDCPTEQMIYVSSDSAQDYVCSMYMFRMYENCYTTPAETSLKLNYVYNGGVPQMDSLLCVNDWTFKVQSTLGDSTQVNNPSIIDTKKRSGYNVLVIDDFSDKNLTDVAAIMNRLYGSYKFRVDENGGVYIDK